MSRPSARRLHEPALRPTPAPAVEAHEVGHFVGMPQPGTYISTFTFQHDGRFRSITSGPVSKRKFNTHFLRHQGWLAIYWMHGRVPQEAIEWTG